MEMKILEQFYAGFSEIFLRALFRANQGILKLRSFCHFTEVDQFKKER